MEIRNATMRLGHPMIAAVAPRMNLVALARAIVTVMNIA